MYGIIIAHNVREHIISALRDSFPEEGCGVLVGRELEDGSIEVTSAEALPNAETVRGEDRFVIEPHAYAELEHRLTQQSDDTRIVGFFHSHPNGAARPSSVDLEAAMGLFEVTRTFYVYAIAALTGDRAELTYWKLNENADGFVEMQIAATRP